MVRVRIETVNVQEGITDISVVEMETPPEGTAATVLTADKDDRVATTCQALF